MASMVRELPQHPLLGRTIVEHDDRSRGYAVRELLAQVERSSIIWPGPRTIYDQGSTSSCVGQSVKRLINTRPISARLRYEKRARLDPMKLYREAQKLDPWEGESYEGTSTLAGFKAAKKHGYLAGEYRWCFGLDDVLDAVSAYGPVVIGIEWTYGMFEPDDLHMIHPTGTLAGGHAILLAGIDVENELVTLINSWGRGWGYHGRCFLSWADLDDLLRRDGEAVTIKYR